MSNIIKYSLRFIPLFSDLPLKLRMNVFQLNLYFWTEIFQKYIGFELN